MSTASVADRLQVALKGAFCHGPVPEAEIQKAEVQLGVQFPPSLRLFLSAHGAALGDGYELAGLPQLDRAWPERTPQWSDLVAVTVRARMRPASTLMPQFLCVAHDGAECAYLLNPAVVDRDGECPVVALEPGRNYEQVADSFVEFAERIAGGKWL